MTTSKDQAEVEKVVVDLLDATAKAILDMHEDIAELRNVFVPIGNAIFFLEDRDIDPPDAAYQLLLLLITSGAATISADEE